MITPMVTKSSKKGVYIRQLLEKIGGLGPGGLEF